MVDSINTQPVPRALSPHHIPTRGDADDSVKTDGAKLNNRAALSATKTDSTENHEPCEKSVTVEDNPVRQASNPPRNEPPGSRIDVLV